MLHYVEQAATIFRVVDQLSLPFCQLKLRDLFNSLRTVQASMESLPAAFINYFKLAPEVDHTYLLDVATGMDAAFMHMVSHLFELAFIHSPRQIRECAEGEILSSSAFLCDPIPNDGDRVVVDLPPCIPRLLDLICAANVECIEESQSILVAIVERLRGIAELIHKIESRLGDPNDAPSNGDVLLISTLCSWYVDRIA